MSIAAETPAIQGPCPGAGPVAGAGPAMVLGQRVGWVDKVLDRLLERAADDEGYEVSSGDVAEVHRLEQRFAAAKLALVAKAERQQAHRRTGHSSTAAWVAGITHSGGGAATAQVGIANALDEGLPVVKDAVVAGEVSVRNAGIVIDAMGKLPEVLTESERAKVESSLVRDAKRLEPGRLRRAALGALAAAEKSAAEVAAHAEEQLVTQEQAAYRCASITMHDRGDGTTTGRFVVPTAAAHTLRKVLQSMTSPRRDHQRTAVEERLADGQQPAGDLDDGSVAAALHGEITAAGQGAVAPAGGQDGWAVAGGRGGLAAAPGRAGEGVAPVGRNSDWGDLDWAQKRGRAFVDLLEHLDTQRLTGRVASTVIVTMTLEQALGAEQVAALAQDIEAATGEQVEVGPDVGPVRTDTGHRHSTAEARRLACGAGILPVVLGGEGLPVDVGREQRFFTEPQRTALATVYEECAADGCDRPYAWAELHHQDPWSRGGPSDLERAVPLCGYHHRAVHDDRRQHRISTDPVTARKTVHFTTG